MSPPRRASLLQTGVVLTTALYQRRRNEIWCNVMWWWSIAGKCWPGLKQTGSGSPLHWTLPRVDTPYADSTWPVYLSVCICACAIWWSSPKAITKGASNTRRFTSPWEKRRSDLRGVGKFSGGENWRRVSGLQQCLPYSERSSVLACTAFSDTHTFYPALQIYDLSHTHTHTHTHTLTHTLTHIQ